MSNKDGWHTGVFESKSLIWRFHFFLQLGDSWRSVWLAFWTGINPNYLKRSAAPIRLPPASGLCTCLLVIGNQCDYGSFQPCVSIIVDPTGQSTRLSMRPVNDTELQMTGGWFLWIHPISHVLSTGWNTFALKEYCRWESKRVGTKA